MFLCTPSCVVTTDREPSEYIILNLAVDNNFGWRFLINIMQNLFCDIMNGFINSITGFSFTDIM